MRKMYQIRRLALVIVTGFTVILASCKEESDADLKPSLSIPRVYDSLGYRFNSEPLQPLVQQFTTLVDEAKKGRQRGVYVSEESLNSAFTQGSFSLLSITTPYYISRLQAQNNGYFAELSKASGGSFYPFDRSWEGGVFGSYLFDEYGLEMEQMIEKGLYGAALYNYAMSLTNGTFTEATADQILFLYGASPMFYNSDNRTFYQNPDRLMAAYAARRDDASGTGLYSQTRLAFITLQAALKGGEDYVTYRDDALAAIKLNWEKANAATVINSLHMSISTLNSTSQGDQERSEVMHLISEAAGFLHGWRTIDAKNKKITDAQIDEILALLNVPYDRSAAVYRFVTNTQTELPKLMEAVGKIQGIYGFTNEEVENFRRNYVADQGR
ncbi:hypothetical protein GCM10028803_42810 [Larkinella knui]|uniref:DUF4856 domain-containing protein n=1 Tax=Larkinella knui TaxID=2025310 RepID=A0A3P1CNS8_9BACT|nr:hypothetical protein [Larkinella knui]RRB14909.1 hypothetical protein EHT87_10095 [Larkinella knui]